MYPDAIEGVTYRDDPIPIPDLIEELDEILSRPEPLRANYEISEWGLQSIAVHASHVEQEHRSLGPRTFERYCQSADMQNRLRFTRRSHQQSLLPPVDELPALCLAAQRLCDSDGMTRWVG